MKISKTILKTTILSTGILSLPLATISLNSCSKDATIKSIEVTTKPTKMTYAKGEKLDLRGMVVTGTMSDGTTKQLEWGEYTASPTQDFRLMTQGEQEIKISVNDSVEPVSFKVTVGAAVPASIIIYHNPDKNVYSKDETLNLTGLEIKYKASDDTISEVLPSTDYETEPAAGETLTESTYVQIKLKNYPNVTTEMPVLVLQTESTTIGAVSWEELSIWSAAYGLGYVSGVDFWDRIKLNDSTVPTSFNQYVGQTRTISIDGIEHQLRIIGVNHDKITGYDYKALFTFQFNNVLSIKNISGIPTPCKTMWDADSTLNYLNSKLRKNLTGQGMGTFGWIEKTVTKTLYDMLPQDLSSRLRPVDKDVTTFEKVGDVGTITTYSDYLFLPSMYEIGFTNPESLKFGEEGTCYDLYTGATKAKRKILDANQRETAYCLVSPYLNGKNKAIHIIAKDGDNGNAAVYQDNGHALAPCFCI